MERVATLKPVTPMQLVVAVMLGLNMTHEEIAAELEIGLGTVRDHIARLSKRIPGDMPATSRVVAWVRGASLDVLEGRTLRYEVMRDGMGAAQMMAAIDRDVAAAARAQPPQAASAMRTKL